jgi:hypothetical protein
MPTQLAEYGIAMFALGMVGWLVRYVIKQLMSVITNNTSVLKELSTLIRMQSQLVKELLEDMQEMKKDLAYHLGKEDRR